MVDALNTRALKADDEGHKARLKVQRRRKGKRQALDMARADFFDKKFVDLTVDEKDDLLKSVALALGVIGE